MDIVFQSGDFFGEVGGFDVVSDLVMPVVSILASVFIAVGIFKAEKRSEKRKQNRETKDRIDFFKEHYKAIGEGVIEDVARQISNYEESINDINLNPFETPLLKIVPLGNLDRILEMDSQLVLEMLKESELSNSDLIKLLNGLHFLKDYLDLIYDSFEAQKDQIIVAKNNMLDLGNEILEESANYLGKYPDGVNGLSAILNKMLVDYSPVPTHEDLITKDPENVKRLDTLVLKEHYGLKVNNPIIRNILKGGYDRIGIVQKLISSNKKVNDVIYSIEHGNKDFAQTLLTRIQGEKGMGQGLNQIKNIIQKL